MKLLFTIPLSFVVSCSLLSMQKDPNSLGDSLVELNQALTILEGTLKKVNDLSKKPQQDVQEEIDHLVKNFYRWEFSFLTDFLKVYNNPQQIKNYYRRRLLSDFFSTLEEPLDEMLIALQNINKVMPLQSNFESIFLPDKFEEFNGGALYAVVSFKLNTFLDKIRELKEQVFKSGANASIVKQLDDATENIRTATDAILKELNTLNETYKVLSQSKC